MNKFGILSEFVDFLLHSKKYWLLPILFVLLIMGLIIAMTPSVITPFLYPF